MNILACLLALTMFSIGYCETVPLSFIEQEPKSSTVRLFTNLQLILRADSQEITAVVTNVFTFLPSVVPVWVELYSSDTYTTDYNMMTLKAWASTYDLDMGQELTVTYPNEKKNWYWMARAIYREGTGQYQELFTDVFLITEDGETLFL